MRSTARETSTTLRTWLVFLLATVPAAGAAVAGGGPCFSVSVDQAMVLPGGAEYAPGTLTICVTRALSPVAALHKTYVDGKPVAMLMSRTGVGEGAGDGRPFVMFQRDGLGRLHLYGLAAPSGGRMANYRLWQGARLSSNQGSENLARATDAEGTVLVAAQDPNGRRTK